MVNSHEVTSGFKATTSAVLLVAMSHRYLVPWRLHFFNTDLEVQNILTTLVCVLVSASQPIWSESRLMTCNT